MCNQTAWLIQPWEGEANRLFPSCSYEPNFRAEVWLELSWPGGTPNLNTYLASPIVSTHPCCRSSHSLVVLISLVEPRASKLDVALQQREEVVP
jgi:hypothetical protein